MGDPLNSTMIQDVTKSVDQLCAQLSMSSIIVPRFDANKDVFDFINEFELVTATLPEEHKVKILVKAFPPGRLSAWYEANIKPLVLQSCTWQTIKSKIINRYADTEDRDRHFQRLKDLKFEPHGHRKLFDYVEEVSFSFSKAFPREGDDSKIRYIKANMPQELKSSLAGITECVQSSNLEEFMRGIRRYDTIRSGSSDTTTNKVQGNELVTIFKDLLQEFREERQTSKNVLAALQDKSRDQSPGRSRQRDPSPSSSHREHQSRRNSNNIHINRERSMSPYRQDSRAICPPIRRQSVERIANNNNSNYNYNHNPNNNNPYQHNYINNQQSHPNEYSNYYNNPLTNNNNNPTRLVTDSPNLMTNQNHQRPMERYQFNRGQERTYNNTNNNNQSRIRANTGLYNEEQYYEKFGCPSLPCAPVFKQDIINILSSEPHLLSARFEINGKIYSVMIDTGATISCIPEFGEVMKNSQSKLEKANVTVNLANNSIEHINKKVRAFLRPAGSTKEPKLIQIYIQNKAYDIFGYQALIGLNHLKLFQLNIDIRNGVIHIFHNNTLIGQESPTLKQTKASLKIIPNNIAKHEDPQITRILTRFKKVFTELDSNPIVGKPMRFYTVHQRPIFAKQRHYTVDEVLEMKTHLTTLLDKGIIEPTNSGYAASSRIIPKKNGSGRLVVNYIPLNAATYRDSYALPHVTDILGVLQGKEYFSTMDCAQGFYQILVDPRDRHKTAFSTPIGNFQFTRCPFGAKNSCAMFQSEMNRIFCEGLYTKCVIYVDDILVFGKTRKEHDENLEWVLNRCQLFNVKIKLEKCHFAKKEVKYLGFLISGDSIKPLPEKVDVLQKTEAPKDKTELRSIIGKLNFYSRFIPDYSKSLEPLRNLLLKNKDYQWKQYHQEAFNKLITELHRVQSQIIVPRSHHKILSLHILKDSFEAILTTPENKLIIRASRLLSTAESNYSFPEKQLLALSYAINKFKLYIEPEKFTVKVSSNGLEKILNLVNKPERIENLLLKMPEGYDKFKLEVDTSLPQSSPKNMRSHIAEEIFYVDGACKANGKPNCRASWAVCAENDRSIQLTGYVKDNPSNQSAELTAAIEACKLAKSKHLNEITIITDSKYLFNAATNWIDRWRANDWKDNKNKPVVHTKLFKDLLEAKQDLDIEWIHVKGHSDNVGNIRADNLARSLLCDKVATLCAITTNGSMLQQNDPETDDLKNRIDNNEAKDFKTIDNLVYYLDKKLPEGSQERLFVPKMSRHWLLTLAHDDVMYGGHLGIKKTFRKLIRFWWPRMHTDIESYVKSCRTCQKFKQPTGLPPGYLRSIPVSQAFEHIHLDMIGPITTTYNGNSYVITATDAFSKWAFAQAYQTITAKDIIKFVEERILAIHGKPQCIITDRGRQFISDDWKSFIDKLKIEHRMTTPYHPQSNGIDERLNGTLVRILRAYVDKYQENWDEQLKWSLYVYNTTVHESTGYSPYQILHGMDPRSPLEPRNINDIHRRADIQNNQMIQPQNIIQSHTPYTNNQTPMATDSNNEELRSLNLPTATHLNSEDNYCHNLPIITHNTLPSNLYSTNNQSKLIQTEPPSKSNPNLSTIQPSITEPTSATEHRSIPNNYHTKPPNVVQDINHIRSTVTERNRIAQENQRKYYDKKRRPHNLYLGQLVYTRVHVPTNNLSKKFYSKWEGPHAIIGFVGDKNDPKAVKILDYVNMIKKTLAFHDVKPLVDTYRKPTEDEHSDLLEEQIIIPTDKSFSRLNLPQNMIINSHSVNPTNNIHNTIPHQIHHFPTSLNTTNNNIYKPSDELNQLISREILDNNSPGDENTFAHSSDSRISERFNDHMDKLPTVLSNYDTTTTTTINSTKEDTNLLDFTNRPTGPMSSTPKRVTINDRVSKYTYSNESAPNVHIKRLKTNPRASATLEGLYYIDPRYHVDNITKDPTYKPPVTIKPSIKIANTNIPDNNQPKLSSQSQIPRYNLRSQPTNSNDLQQLQEQNIISNQNPSTDINNNTAVQQVNPRTPKNGGSSENPMENIQINRNTQPMIIDINEDNFISFSDTDN